MAARKISLSGPTSSLISPMTTSAAPLRSAPLSEIAASTRFRISCVIYCERKSHKGIIIGKQGKKLKGIGKAAREELEALLGTKIFLELWVKVRENWRDSDRALFELGYKEREQ